VAAILVVLSVPGGMALYGSLAVILLAYLTRFQALALRPVAALRAVDAEGTRRAKALKPAA
jgi:iron(III) transport system permease protein